MSRGFTNLASVFHHVLTSSKSFAWFPWKLSACSSCCPYPVRFHKPLLVITTAKINWTLTMYQSSDFTHNWEGRLCYPHFTVEETEVQRDLSTCPRSHSPNGFISGRLITEPTLLNASVCKENLPLKESTLEKRCPTEI